MPPDRPTQGHMWSPRTSGLRENARESSRIEVHYDSDRGLCCEAIVLTAYGARIWTLQNYTRTEVPAVNLACIVQDLGFFPQFMAHGPFLFGGRPLAHLLRSRASFRATRVPAPLTPAPEDQTESTRQRIFAHTSPSRQLKVRRVHVLKARPEHLPFLLNGPTLFLTIRGIMARGGDNSSARRGTLSPWRQCTRPRACALCLSTAFRIRNGLTANR